MKKLLCMLLLALVLSGCAAEPAEAAAAEPPSEITETAAETETVPETSVPATEPEFFTETEGVTARDVCLDPTELRPEGLWKLGGIHVYYGHYEGVPMVFRVLSAPESQLLSEEGGGLLLDCESILLRQAFDDDFHRNDAQVKQPSEWKGSDPETWLNGENFYGNGAVFTNAERAAIASTALAERSEPYSTSHWAKTFTDLATTNHVFLLSAEEAEGLYADDGARVKGGASICWWLRSTFGMGGNGAASVHGDGHVCNNSISNFAVGLSPAMNVKLSSVLLATPAGRDKSLDFSAPGSRVEESSSRKWKLTILDPDKRVEITDGQKVSREGNVVTVPYTYGGEGVNQISVMITDRACTGEGVRVLYYGALQGKPEKTGTGFFTLPEELTDRVCREDYYVYLLAEDVNGEHETDYAGPFCAIVVPPEAEL